LTVVSIVKSDFLNEAVIKSVEMSGGLDIRKGDVVVIKPNVKSQSLPGYGIVTDPKVIEPLIPICLDKGASKIVFAEGCAYPSGSYHTISAFEAAGYTDLAKKWDVRLVDLNSWDSVVLDVEDGFVLEWVRVGRAVVDADFLINVPVLKTHKQTLLSNCVKNIGVGIACREEKKRLHQLGIERALVDVYSKVIPQFNLVDAVVAMEGDGPNLPPAKAKPLGLIISGKDGLAVDAVCARIMGIKPSRVVHLKLANQKGLGTIDSNEIEIVGETVENVAVNFELPSTFEASPR
jgi:uncharacterized protein (DUF362 family)